ncbi:MAG TPA: ABC transporter ATP-binding protein [Rhodanobacteraceae bacterium]|nr:ABC transporter ATP-binding protein [Rhodanobacteraceae bacterium]
MNATAEARGQPIVELRSVRRAFGPIVAVRDVDLVVWPRELLVILGESGSGKTTLLKMINRFQPPDSGDVLIDGRSTSTVVEHELRRGIGYVFQRVGLFPHLTVAENIAVTPRLLGWSDESVRARVDELLALVNLPAVMAPRLPAALSGGQRQRVGVARALAARPKIMLMDEPFGALDPITRDGLSGEYRLLHERMGLVTVMVTHDVLEALLLADRIVVMREGAIVASGTPHEMMNDPKDAEVRKLMDMPRRQMTRVAAMLDGARRS